ncbi:type II secretion system F family protein [Halopseudomonas yangmingensis]|uniref:Tight adherence protein B n=1 Tax=Halopseudomonas yangmingensis TaxID=1720063 RepID=A0A1I4ULM7_9GAMM|nr:type II secretion system F family protein [Halopseudomonas yangmingensis]SFM89897.1 tight adherence protein B [Halopseudomonas yangmingensis]
MLIAALLFAISVTVVTFAALRVASSAAEAYREQFTAEAKVSLSELYLFIEPEKLYFLNVLMLLIGFLFTLLLTQSLIPALIVAVLLLAAPKMLYRVIKKKRLDKVLNQLPDALLSIASSMKAGSSLNQALEVTVKEDAPPLAQELELLLRELRVGVAFEKALDNLAARVPSNEMDMIAAAMKISREVGGNLSEILERVASTIRRKREMEGKILALTAQGKLQGLVMTGLPFLLGVVLYHMEPVHMSRLFHEPAGWIAISLILVLVTLGYVFIRKIVNIDV